MVIIQLLFKVMLILLAAKVKLKTCARETRLGIKEKVDIQTTEGKTTNRIKVVVVVVYREIQPTTRNSSRVQV